MHCPILQFGTSRFLQAHVDLFVSEARKDGQDCGPIAVVQTPLIARLMSPMTLTMVDRVAGTRSPSLTV